MKTMQTKTIEQLRQEAVAANRALHAAIMAAFKAEQQKLKAAA